MNKSRTSMMIALVAGTLLIATSAMATPIYISMSHGSGASSTAEDTSNRWWNLVMRDGGVTDAVDANNAATTVDLNVSAVFTNSIGASGATPTLVDWPDFATDGQWYTSEATSTFLIQGLDAGLTYDIKLYAGSNRTDSNRGLIVDIDGTTQSGNFGDVNHLGETLLTFSGISPTANEIQVDVLKGGYLFSYLNAIEITPVPEPATMGLLAIGGIALLRRKRRK